MSRSDKDDELRSPAAAALWRRAGHRPERGPEAPDPLLIAAYVDGTLDPRAGARVEAWMAGSSDALDLVVAARAAPADAPLAAPPPGLLVRARGLVRRPAMHGDGRRTIGNWVAGLAPSGIWAATAASMLLVAVVSFQLGREATVTLASSQTQTLTVAAADDDGLGFGPAAGDLL